MNSTTNQVQHVLDPTTPWYEWISYCECCKSLGFEPSMGRFLRYHEYLRSVFNSEE